MYKVYGDLQSGNCYKVKLTLALLGIPHRWQHIDILGGETSTDEFLALNPNGKIPVLSLDDDTHLTESNAILHYLADGTFLLPEDKLGKTQVLSWMFFEQYSHEPYIAVARFIQKYLGLPDEEKARYLSLRPKGYKALEVMEKALDKSNYLVGSELSIADISLFAYTHVADEGGFELTNFPAISSWIERIRATPSFLAMNS